MIRDPSSTPAVPGGLPFDATQIQFTQSGTGAAARSVQSKERDSIAIGDFGPTGDGVSSDQTPVANAIAASVSRLLVNDGLRFLVTSLTNTLGIEFTGAGKIVKAISGGLQQLNTYAGTKQYVLGREYLSHFHKNLIAGSAATIVFSGDSTTSGTGASTPYRIWELVPEMANIDGYQLVTGNNQGHSGESTVEWLATRLGPDLALNPDLYVIRWGINDPYSLGSNLTVAQFIANIRTGLTTIRASKTLAQMSVLLMMPNSTSDTATNRDEKFYESIQIGLKQAAKDFQCAFADTYAWLQDSRNSTDYMDGPPALHPANVMNLWISSLICEAIFPKGLRQLSASAVRNITGTALAKAVGDATSTYARGVSIHRATPGGFGANWPYDGVVVTFNHIDNVQLQINFGSNNTFSSVAIRLGQASVWQAWNYLPRGQGNAVTAANNLSLGEGSYFHVNGNTQINVLDNTNVTGGFQVTLKFNGTPTVKYNQAASGNFKPIILNGAVDFVAAANDTLTLIYDSANVRWTEIARKV